MLRFIGACTLGFIAICVLIAVASMNSHKRDAAAAASTSPDNRTPQNWEYSSDVNDVTGVRREWACASSVDRDSQLCFRRTGKRTESYVQLGHGQFWCNENCSVHVKVDDRQPFSSSAGEAETNTQYIFIEQPAKMLSLVSKAKAVAIDVPIFEEGRDVLHFQVAGLTWK